MSTGSNSEAAMQGVVAAPSFYERDRRALRVKVLGIGACLLILSLFSLCVDPGMHALLEPGEVLTCYSLWFQQLWASLFDPHAVMEPNQILAQHQAYFRIVNQAAVTFFTALAGFLLALSGALYQNVFRNPIASPTMLGVSSGVRLGVLLLVVIFGTAALNAFAYRYLLCYSCVIVTLVALFALTKLMSGKGRPLNVVNMLLVGTIINQLVGVVITFVTWYWLDQDLWQLYNYLTEALVVDTGWYSFVAMGVACVVSFVPIYLLRFRLNALSYDATDMKMLGIDSVRLQVVALVCGTIMIMAAQVQVGNVAMVSLVVPHISRAFFGAEFRKQLMGNMLLGAAVLMLCRCIVCFIPFVGDGLPIGTVVDFVVLPAFVWILAKQQKGWE